MFKRLLVAFVFGVLGLSFAAGASAAEIAPTSVSATAEPESVSWPDSPQTSLRLAVESGPEGADFRFMATPEGWGIDGVDGNPLYTQAASLDGPGTLKSEDVVVADLLPTACYRGEFQGVWETFRLTLPPNTATTVEIPVRATGAPLAGMTSAVDVDVLVGDARQTYRTEIPVTGREGVRIVGTVEGTEGQQVSRRPWQPMRVVGQTYPAVKHAWITVRAEPRMWHGKPGKTGTHKIFEAYTRKDGSFRTNVGYLAARADWRLIATPSFFRGDNFDAAPSCLPVVSIEGRDYDEGLIGGKAPRVKDLLNRSFTSVSAVGDPKIRNRTVQMSFFMHASYANAPKRPTMSVWAGCNEWGTKFRIRRGRLFSTGATSSTGMGCNVDPDPWLMEILDKGVIIRGEAKRLILTRPADGVRIVLRRFAGPVGSKPKPEPRTPTFRELLDRQYKSIRATGNPLLEGKTVYVNFFKGATSPNLPKRTSLAVYAGCNNFGSKAAIKNGRLFMYGSGSSNGAGCEDETDSWLWDRFRKSFRVEMIGKRLVLTRPGDGIKLVLVRSDLDLWE